MVKRLDPEDRNLLEFRPSIRFIEPEVISEVIEPIEELQSEDIKDKRRQVKQLAKAVDILATTIQAMVDDKAKNMKIKLDPAVDPAAVAAMNRKFPGENSEEITYDQYKRVKDDLRELGNEIGKKALVTPEQIADERDDADLAQQNKTSNRIAQMGGFDTPEAMNGGLRPELQSVTQIIPPIDIAKIQIDLICVLVNFIWKVFIKSVFKPIAIPPPFGPSLADLLPDKLCDPGGDIELPGLFMLGDDKLPDLLSGAAADSAKTAAGI